MTDPSALFDPEVRKELTDYYKWVVSLATFVLTVSLGVRGIMSKTMEYTWLFIMGWCLLGLCISLDWLLIKRLVAISLLTKSLGGSEDSGEPAQRLIAAVMTKNLQAYAFVQNIAFLLGILSIALAFIVNL